MTGYLEFGWLPGLLGLLLVPAAMIFRLLFGRSPFSVVPYVAAWSGSKKLPSARGVAFMTQLAMMLLIVAAAKPQWLQSESINHPVPAEIVIAIDLSTSMNALDYQGEAGPIDRLAALKPVLKDFIVARTADRISLVVFAGRAYTLVPLTREHSWVIRQIDELQIGMIDDGTAIGDGLGLALTQFEAMSSGGNRFVVLVTDGANTSGTLTPPQSTAVARYLGVPVYTIAAGRDGVAPYPVLNAEGKQVGTRLQPSTVDRESLRTIAEKTAGRYFDGDDATSLASAFEQIDVGQSVRSETRIRLNVRDLRSELLAVAMSLLLGVVVMLWRNARDAVHQRPAVRRGFVVRGKLRLQGQFDRISWRPYVTALALVSTGVLLLFNADTQRVEDQPRRQLLIAMDLSRSMDVRDMLPSRLEHARRLALRVIEQAPEDLEIGLLAFAGDAHLVAPVSSERALLNRALQSLETGDLPTLGSDFAAMLATAAQTFHPESAERFLLVLSDGEAHSDLWQQRLPDVVAQRIRIFSVLLGTQATTPIPVGEAEWLRNPRGMFIYSAARPETLALMSESTAGVAWQAAEREDLLRLVLAELATNGPQVSERWSSKFGHADLLGVMLLLVAFVVALAAVRDVPALPRLGSSVAIMLVIMVVAGTTAAELGANQPVPRRPAVSIQSAEERDALVEMQTLVRGLIVKPDLQADDYQQLAATAINYGAIHRLHAHPLALGVLRDGLQAVNRGRELEPQRAIWAEQEAMLERLLEPPPPAVSDPEEVDPANEPLEGSLAVPDSEVPEPDPQAPERRESDEQSAGTRSLGGGALDIFDTREWADPSVAVPLYLLRELRRTERFGEVFGAITRANRRVVGVADEQTW